MTGPSKEAAGDDANGKGGKRGPPAVQPNRVGPTLRLAVLLGSGVIFGMALEKCRVFEPRNIRLQFLYENFVMMKVRRRRGWGGRSG